jgi:hypothetical protein
MQQFTVVTPEGSIQVDLITGYAIGPDVPEKYQKAEFDVLELIGTLQGRLPSIPVPITAIGRRYPDGTIVSREIASTVRYKEAILESRTTTEVTNDLDTSSVSESDGDIVKEMEALMRKATASGISMVGIMFKKTAEKEGFLVPFMGFPEATKARIVADDMAKSIHAMLHIEGEIHTKMMAISQVFIDGYKQYAMCMLSEGLSEDQDS